MIKEDTLERFIFENIPIRGEVIYLKKTFQTIVEQHNYPAPLKHLMGEALCVAGLLSAIIKFNGRLTVQFRGKGALKLLLAQCDNNNHMRGVAKWDGQLSYEELMESLNDGVLVIMLDGGLKSRYQGIVPWRGNSLAESIEGYFKDSEQLATKIWLAGDDTAVAGFLLQIVPGANKESELVEQDKINEQWADITSLTTQLTPDDLLLLDYEKLLLKLYPHEALRIFDAIKPVFQCTCSRRRGEEAILILGRKEAEQELKNNLTLVVTCDFCNKEYVFDKDDVKKIFNDKDVPPHSGHLH